MNMDMKSTGPIPGPYTNTKRMDKGTRIIVSIGSNFNAKENITLAKRKLAFMLGNDTVFTKEMWTDPIGIESEKFINCICFSTTKHTLSQITKAFKQLEKRCERSKKDDLMNRITLDIDILMYGETKLHIDDWNRDYIKTLMNDYDNNKELFIIDKTL